MNLSELHEEQSELFLSQNILRNVPLFAGLAPEFFSVMAYLCNKQVFAADQAILTEGEPADASVVLIRGNARIERGGHQFATLGKGSCVGGMALLGQFRWLYSLRAETEVECLLLPRHRFLPQFLARPESLALLAGRMIETVVNWDLQMLGNPGDVNPYGLGML